MKALTLWPEWLPTILYMGKDVENRSWKPPDSLVGQRFALHAGMRIGGGRIRQGFEWLKDACLEAGWHVRMSDGEVYWRRVEEPHGSNWRACLVPRGEVMATVRLVGAVRDSPSPWAMRGQWHWVLGNLQLLDPPVSVRGHQGLWNWEG